MPSTVTGAVRRDDTILRLGGHGNDWHTTWAADGDMLIALCDGTGWPNTRNVVFNSHLIRMEGDPPNVTFEDFEGYPDLIDSAPPVGDRPRYQGYATLAVDGKIYQFLTMFGVDRAPDGTPLPEDPHFDGAKLIYSPDGGATWHNQDGSTPVRWEQWDERSKDNMAFWDEPQKAFSLLSFLQMGRDYSANTDGYLYLYGPNGVTVDTLPELVLVRIPKDSVTDRSTWEYFAGHRADGGADWSADIADRVPVHTFPPGWVNEHGLSHSWQPSITYDEPLGLYLMAAWGHGAAVNGEEFSSPSYLGFYVADQPWGPWRQIHEVEGWTPGGDEGARCYQVQIVPKWIAPDGRSFWILWSDFQVRPEADMPAAIEAVKKWNPALDDRTARSAATRPYYAVNIQRVDLQFDDA